MHPDARLPRRTKRYAFSLTALADVLFQLLIFFMLSANLSPYALLPIRAGDGPAQGAGAGGGGGSAVPAIIWQVTQGAVVANGQRFGLGDLPALARALPSGPRLLLDPAPEAQVQDMVRVIEILATQGVTAVEVAR